MSENIKKLPQNTRETGDHHWQENRTAYTLNAINALKDALPECSAAKLPTPKQSLFSGLIMFVFALCFALFPQQTLLMSALFLYPLFLLGAYFRFDAVLNYEPLELSPPPKTLPALSLLVPLYQEAHLVPELIENLSHLEYDKEKLQILFLLEEDDTETQRAFTAQILPEYMFTLILPPFEPFTKPKALTAALPMVTGEIVGVYDAEDLPHPQQLLEVVNVFAKNERIAAVQMPLLIDNANSFLSRHFLFEYAAWFLVILPEGVRRRWSLPLGGTSNFFQTKTLRHIGAWDPYNVTEDADLGIRLKRFGHPIALGNLPTLEEAPTTLPIWLKQRTRWFKGWIQTLSVTYSLKIFKTLSLQEILGISIVLGGSLMGALLYPFAFLMVLYSILHLLNPVDIFSSLFSFAGIFVFIFGHAAPLLALKKGGEIIGKRFSMKECCTVPIYWFLSSIAAWRAVFQFFSDPHAWEKTPHKGRKTL